MKPATPKTAAIAGVWAGFGGLLFQAWVDLSHPAPQIKQYVFVGGALVFFMIPWFLFVVGVSDENLFKHMWKVFVRNLCWLAGASVAAMLGVPIVFWMRAS